MKRVVQVAVLVAGIGLVLYFLNESNFVENEFASPTEVRATRSSARVGVPDWLPESAREIHHVHNLDTWKVMVRFEMPRDTAVALPSECRPVQRSELHTPPMSRDWWRGEVPSSADAFYQCASGQFVALEKTRGYIWGTP